MRIDALQLIAFGPFTGSILDLSKGREGLHVVYGQNEAGKSSALRALRNLLYGIPVRSNDNFLHPYPQMRIGAVLKTGSGKTLEIIRRKGRVGTLRDAQDDAIVEEAALQQFLMGVDADLFATMFGISHEDLVKGGRDIIQGGGDVGRLIFSAGSGIANLREIQTELESQAAALFLPRGQRAINEHLKLLKDSQKELRESLLTGQDWVNLNEALQSAKTRKKSVDAELAERQKERNRFKRVGEALPLIARRAELIEELGEYAGAVLLSPEFAEKRRELNAEQVGAAVRRKQAGQNIEDYRRDIAELAPEPALLENTGAIEEFHRELGSQRKAAKDRIELVVRRKTCLGEARAILRSLRDDLSLEQAETLRIHKTEAVRIQKLGTLFERIHARMEESRDRLPEIVREIAGTEEELASLPETREIEELQNSLAEAIELRTIEKQLFTETAEIKAFEKAVSIEQKKLGFETHPAEDLERLPVPSLETVGVFETDMADAASRMKDIGNEIRKAKAGLAETDRQIEADRLQQEVPTEGDLQQARALRDQGWQLIAGILADKAPSEDEIRTFLDNMQGAQTLAAAFQEALTDADAVSDRLRREADRVVAKARLLADQAAYRKEIDQAEKERRDAAKRRETLDTQWNDLWKPSGVSPRTPREMAQWIRDFQALASRIGELRIRRKKADASREQISAQRQKLVDCLKALGEPEPAGGLSFSGLVKRAEALIQKEQENLQRRNQLERDKKRKEKERSAAKERLASTEAELKQWQGRWQEAVAPIGLKAEALPEEATAFMEELKDLFDKIKEAGILQSRIEGIDRDADRFAEKVENLVRVVAPDLSGRSSEEAAMDLHQRLKKAVEASTRKETLQKQLEQEKKRYAKAEDDISRIETELDVLCKEARCENPDQLVEAEKRSDRRRQIESELKATDEQLRHLSAGATVEVFVAEAVEIDPDSIAGRIERLEESIEALEEERSNLDKEIGVYDHELKKMDGTSRAAALAEDIQTILGSIERHAEQYARLKIAAKVLSMAIERYSEKSQGPILKRASELFCRITHGSFEGLRADLDENGQPMIVGSRPGSREFVAVEAMSDGTADQLYLALRLAGLEMYLEKNEPLPFVVDDILIMFDDIRAAATLEILAELSKRTQVIFFTHHRHLVDLAERNIDSAALVTHTLER
ncbi:MAG: AAA family ATPase [Desulfobacterales bacterium]|nr:AAA family ATPase [Desulfobacterales bacterium]